MNCEQLASFVASWGSGVLVLGGRIESGVWGTERSGVQALERGGGGGGGGSSAAGRVRRTVRGGSNRPWRRLKLGSVGEGEDNSGVTEGRSKNLNRPLHHKCS